MNEEMVNVLLQKNKTKCIGLRFFTVYGEWGRPDMFMMKYLNATYNKSKVFYLNNYGNHFRDFTYVNDVCKILRKLIYSKLKYKHLIINICSNKPLKLTKIIKEIDNFLTYKLPNNLLGKIWKGKYRGQKQKWFIMRFVGNEEDINIKTKNAEFKEWKWIDVNQLINVVVSFKLDVYKSIVKELNILLN